MGHVVAARGRAAVPSTTVRMAAVLAGLALIGIVGALVGIPTSANTVNTVGTTVLLRDSFVGRDNPTQLGRAPGGELWRAALGTWGTKNRTAYVSVPAPDANLAYIETPSTHEEISLTLGHVEDNSGLVFRYHDPSNYWAVLTATPYAIFYVVKVVDGKQTVVAKTPLISLVDPTRVTVRVDGTTAQVWAYSGAEIIPPVSFTDPYLATSTRAGLIVLGEGAARVRFKNFVVSR